MLTETATAPPEAPSTMNLKQVARWARQEAARYIRLAKQIEADFDLSSRNDATVGYSLEDMKRVREYMASAGPKRAAEIERNTGVSADAVKLMCEAPNCGLKLGTRGWISYEPGIDEEDEE